MDKLNALTIFCTLAETLHFKATADRLAVSPQVISRMINQLEQQLGESLFQRNTRQVQLTDFGRSILPKAQQILQQSEQFFSHKPQQQIEAIHGIVRLTVPNAPIMHEILPALLKELQAYPSLHIDWRMDMKLTDKIAERIDIGVRMGNPPHDNSLIVKKVAEFHEKIVASPELINRLGYPKDLEDLRKNYPLVGFINQSEKVWNWELSNQQSLHATQYHFISNNLNSHLQAALQGHSIAFLHHTACQDHLQQGELIELFPKREKKQWGIYIYRPYRNITPTRIKLVFKHLEQVIKNVMERYRNVTPNIRD